MNWQITDAPLSLAGGALIGAAAGLYFATHGRVAGVSGMFAGVLERASDWRTRAWFVGGLVAVGTVLAWSTQGLFTAPAAPLAWVAIAGLLVGFGTHRGNGCTSGHGVCGTSRLSIRSIVATMTFIATGALTVLATRWIGDPR